MLRRHDFVYQLEQAIGLGAHLGSARACNVPSLVAALELCFCCCQQTRLISGRMARVHQSERMA